MNTKVMGIVNVTPDSFSDGGKYFRPQEALARARNMIAEGADIIDLGGESTRPGATKIGWEEEWARIEPVVTELSKGTVPISVDTYHPETAVRALDRGAAIINCVSMVSAPDMVEICAEKGAELVIPVGYFEKMWGVSPEKPRGVSPEKPAISPQKIYIDPMIGFGTTRQEDLSLLRSVPELAKRGRLLVGASRKRIIKKLTGEKVAGKNLGGNLALAVWCALNGASVVRVHDVKETVQALNVVAALEGQGEMMTGVPTGHSA